MRTTFLIVFASVLILAQTAFGGDLEFRKVTINDDSLFSAGAAYDVDHDGDIDIVCGGFWYEAPVWRKHKIRDGERFERDGMPDGFAAQPYDMNQDGWMDFFKVNYRSRSFKWIEHPGASLGEWTARTIAEPGPMESGRLYDIDGDGQLDMLTNNVRSPSWRQFVPRTLADGSQTTEFVQRALPSEMTSHGIAFGDVNNDERDDVVSGKGWAEAPADRINGDWKRHPEFEIGAVSVPFLVNCTFVTLRANSSGADTTPAFTVRVWAELRGLGVPVYGSLGEIGRRPDVIHGHHRLETLTALPHFADAPAVGFCHGLKPWQEAPLKQPRVLQYVAASQPTADRVRRETSVPAERSHRIPNSRMCSGSYHAPRCRRGRPGPWFLTTA